MAGTRSLGEALEHHSLKEKIVNLETALQSKEQTIVEVIKEVPVEVIKYVDRIVEIEKEVSSEIKVIEKFIDKEIHIIPKWVFGIIAFETLLIIVMLVKLL